MDSEEKSRNEDQSYSSGKDKKWNEEEDHLILKFVHKNKISKVKKIFWKGLCLELPHKDLYEI